MKSRPRPVPDALDQAVFHRVAMQVIQAAFQIVLVANEMFPKSALPDASFAFFAAGLTNRYLKATPGQKRFRESRFHAGPS